VFKHSFSVPKFPTEDVGLTAREWRWEGYNRALYLYLCAILNFRIAHCAAPKLRCSSKTRHNTPLHSCHESCRCRWRQQTDVALEKPILEFARSKITSCIEQCEAEEAEEQEGNHLPLHRVRANYREIIIRANGKRIRDGIGAEKAAWCYVRRNGATLAVTERRFGLKTQQQVAAAWGATCCFACRGRAAGR
jgi:hypothetical protein